ncbi:uncharacterized protein B0P05DRAFT_557778 [Gilbertella persicaria]|uniref:uncharacterized protein n=1 Tax=Gilbertella persicaria TaxID=101096 RepID=UPI00221FBFAC|nr:uncharacterized protein B0P05DRAFT_557778 [Gilbertella persicaria]KAI8060666.1 hypothetical protein B0P05DRAFT_557778 [Gilbertella persicaria]
METEPVSIKNDDMIMLEQQSVLDTTENFILNQFTSDQEGNQMIELKDIFPFGMQEEAIVSQPCYTHYAYQEPYNNFDSSVPVYDTPSDPIVGIQSLFNADASTMPSMSIPSDDHNMTQLQEQNMVADYNNAAYVAAAAAATAAAFTSIPNATLHNKLLATLPRQTLASAERLLSPAKRRSATTVNNNNEPLGFVPDKNKQPQHYFGSFQLETSGNPTHPTRKRSSTNSYNTSMSSSNSSTTSSEDKPPICSNCETTTTPLWRRSTDDKILCNACGLYFKLHNIPRPRHLKPSFGKNNGRDTEDGTENENIEQQKAICSNCGTSKTPLWRRDHQGAPLCNACGLYLKLHNEKRPLSMKTDVIKKRQRTEALIASTSSSDDTAKKPRYYDQQSLYAANDQNTPGYRNTVSSLPGTGILMMTNNKSI